MKRIALVEGNKENRRQISILLEDEFDVVEFDHGDAAVAGLVDANPDLVLLDTSVRRLKGTTVLEHLRSDPRTTGLPIIALSAHTMVGDRMHYLSLGFDGHTSKPIMDGQVLLDEIDELLQAKERSKEHGLVEAPAQPPRASGCCRPGHEGVDSSCPALEDRHTPVKVTHRASPGAARRGRVSPVPSGRIHRLRRLAARGRTPMTSRSVKLRSA